MKIIAKWVIRFVLAVVIFLAGVWVFGPREPVDLSTSFDPAVLGDDLDAYLAGTEAKFADITPGVEKRIVWAGAAGRQTPLSIVYLHGFSATSEEIRPVPDRVAQVLGANLYFARLNGHGLEGAALAKATVGDWMDDTAEALDIGRALGERVVVIATSTGGTLAAAAAHDPAMFRNVNGIVFVSPNFGINNPMAPILTWPLARYWVPFAAGATRSFTPSNEGHATYWTHTYPTVALMPMAALVKYVASLDYTAISVPALFYFSDKDTVVEPVATHKVIENWGGPVRVISPVMGESDDRNNHVISGEILSPGQIDVTIDAILDWVLAL